MRLVLWKRVYVPVYSDPNQYIFTGLIISVCRNFSDAAYRFYRTRCEEASVSRRGKASQKLTTKRRHERLTRVSSSFFEFIFLKLKLLVQNDSIPMFWTCT